MQENMTVAEIIAVLSQVDPAQRLGLVTLKPLSDSMKKHPSREGKTHELELYFGHGAVGVGCNLSTTHVCAWPKSSRCDTGT